MLSQKSKGNTKIVTDSRDPGRKKGVQGQKEEEEAGPRESSCSVGN